MDSFSRRGKLVLLIILFVAGFLRFYRLNELPPGLHRDEASAGWNAYAIWKTGRDEHQRRLPLVFEAFGDWKRPLNIYLTAVLVPIFGLNKFSVRAPIALLGTLSVGLIYLVTKEIFCQPPAKAGSDKTVRGQDCQWSEVKDKLPFLSAGLLAISPWHVYMSRTGLGWNTVGLFLTLLAIYLVLIARRRIALITLAAVVFGLSLFSYASNQIFTPLFLLALGVVYSKEFKISRGYLLPALVFGLFLLIFLKIYLPVFQINAVGSGLLDEIDLYDQVTLPQSEHPSLLTAKLFHNRYLVIGLEFVKNYFRVLSPEFLLFNTSDNPAYSLKHFGNLYLFEFPLIIFGLFLIWQQDRSALKILLPWLFLAVIPAALTRTPYSSTRTILILPALLILVAYAASYLYFWLSTKTHRLDKLFLTGISLGYLFFFTLFVDEYFRHFSINRAEVWGVGKEKIVSYLDEHQDEYEQIFIASPEESFYIYQLFYLKIDPENFWQNVEYYSQTEDGFRHVQSLGKYQYQEMHYPQDLQESGRLVVDEFLNLDLWLGDERVEVVKEIPGPASQPVYLIVAVR